MQGNGASSCGEGDILWVFSSCGRHLVYILELRWWWTFETRVCSAKTGLLSSYDGHLGKLNYAWQENTDSSGGELKSNLPLLVGTIILVFLSIFTKCQASSLLKHWTQRNSRSLKWMWGPLSRRGWELWFSLGSPQRIQTSLHLVRWKKSLHLRHFRESRPSFESGNLQVHYTWGRKHRLTLTYLFLREGSSWGAWGKLAYLFIRKQGIILIPRRYGLHGSFLKLL